MLAEAPPVDAAIIAAFGDPGLAAARELFDFPVVGMAEAAILTAVQLGGRFAIVTFTPAMTPWYLASVAALKPAPFTVGFAAETTDVVAHATAKRARKGCDWIVANDVSPATGIMGGSENAVVLISEAGAEVWPRMGKAEVARKLAARIAEALR